jgi:hypothetical protein
MTLRGPLISNDSGHDTVLLTRTACCRGANAMDERCGLESRADDSSGGINGTHASNYSRGLVPIPLGSLPASTQPMTVAAAGIAIKMKKRLFQGT